MPSDTAIIIRTHFFDAAVEDLASRLTSETTLDVLIVVDETKGFVSIPPTFNKLAFNNDDLTRLELATPQRVGWLCGDYFFYVAREHLTSHHYFWIIEPDVIINADHLSTFFQHFNAISDDLLAISLAPRFKHWSWHDAMSEYVPKVYGCLFPILRLSANAVDYLYRKRKLMSHDYLTTNKDIEKIPNDEAVVASYLVNNNFFKCRDINDVVKAYIGWKTFSGVMPISRTFLNLNKRDDFIYHSVRSGEEFKRAYERFLSLIEDTVQLNAAIEALPQVEAELGSDAVNLYQKRLLQIEKFFHEHGALDKKGISHHHGTLVRTTQRIDTFFFIINSNDHVQKQHQKGFFYENDDLLFLFNIINTDCTFVDVGAHTGNHSLFVGLYLKPKKLICFEPNTEARVGLEINLRLNDLLHKADLSMARFALGDRDDEAFIVYSADNWGAGFVTNNRCLHPYSNPAPVRRGDDLLKGQHVDFMKIDIASAVLPVLKGLEATISRSRCGLFLTAIQQERDDVIAFLQAKNYRIVRETIAYQNSHRIVAIHD